MPAGGREPKRKRSAPLNGGGSEVASSGLAMATSSSVEDADALDCGVCFLPLKPPIFQCEVGHVVCSPCRDKLKATGKCHHVYGVATGSYRLCHAMERLVESIRVPCPHAAHGCTARPAYHDREGHRSAPARAMPLPCWPCITNLEADKYGEFAVHLRDGFDFLLADCPTANMKQGATATVQCLLLLTVARQPVGRTISVLCIDPHAAAAANGGDGPAASKQMECRLTYYRPWDFNDNNHHGGHQVWDHYQQSNFRVACTDLSDGMPNPDGCFQFVLTNSVIGAYDRDGIEVRVRIYKYTGRCV
ncbi:hypothetical protein PAHAL_3G126900 [Panicum hallii]|uniref:E3 ubiquitin-protein ligase Sina-like RING finger domain-containing protein n=1 Tax=Panicum hallii TaxID=206008 RepID=A0A2T8KI41_9POAL|nr:hypothetical protein PAHAL_3G126900 [Panicum hallii]